MTSNCDDVISYVCRADSFPTGRYINYSHPIQVMNAGVVSVVAGGMETLNNCRIRHQNETKWPRFIATLWRDWQ